MDNRQTKPNQRPRSPLQSVTLQTSRGRPSEGIMYLPHSLYIVVKEKVGPILNNVKIKIIPFDD